CCHRSVRIASGSPLRSTAQSGPNPCDLPGRLKEHVANDPRSVSNPVVGIRSFPGPPSQGLLGNQGPQSGAELHAPGRNPAFGKTECLDTTVLPASPDGAAKLAH